MKKINVTLLVLLLPAIAFAQKKDRFEPAVLAFTHATVIDATGAPARPEMTVIISGDRITAIGRTGSIRLPANARVINAQGKYLIPGLWDMHARPNLNSRYMFPLFAYYLYLANGVTGLRDMFGPRIVMAGPLVDGTKPAFAGSIAVANEARARQAVISLKQRGLISSKSMTC